MTETRYDALAKVAMHGREHIVILRPSQNGIVLHTMYFVEELHKAKEVPVPKAAKFEKKELDLAKKLIDTLASSFEPQHYHDEYKLNVQKLIESKRKGKKVTPIRQPKTAPVVDLMQALQQSLAKTANARSAAPAKAKAKKTVSRRRNAKVA